MAKRYTMEDHANALMLCAHWATPEADKAAISNFAACISMDEPVEPDDAKIFAARLAEWERGAVVTYYVTDASGQAIGGDFSDKAAALAHKRAVQGVKLMWRQSYPQPVA